jgi:hypothetical protein
MLKVYIDDSNMRQPPFYVLGGWFAPVEVWIKFSDAWREILWMKPRIECFKFSEAMNFGGQFLGFSEESRNEKLRLLINSIEGHGLQGIYSAIPHCVFAPMFGDHFHKFVRNPYFISFYGIVARLAAYLSQIDSTDKVEFVFDYQPGSASMGQAQEGWEEFRRLAPPKFLEYVQKYPPSFLNDKEVVALQAADLHAGWTREMLDILSRGGEPQPIWHPCGDKIISHGIGWDFDGLSNIYKEMFGIYPFMVSYSFRYGMPVTKVIPYATIC